MIGDLDVGPRGPGSVAQQNNDGGSVRFELAATVQLEQAMVVVDYAVRSVPVEW